MVGVKKIEEKQVWGENEDFRFGRVEIEVLSYLGGDELFNIQIYSLQEVWIRRINLGLIWV